MKLNKHNKRKIDYKDKKKRKRKKQDNLLKRWLPKLLLRKLERKPKKRS